MTNKWRDTVHDPLDHGSVHFMLFGRVPLALPKPEWLEHVYGRLAPYVKFGAGKGGKKPGRVWSCWYVYEGPADLLTLKARAEVLEAEGVETRLVRCHVLAKEALVKGEE